MSETLTLTPKYQPWVHQRDAFTSLISGECNRIVTVWHRRAGKDMTALNAMWIMASREVGNYGYFFPFATQGRNAIWEGIGNDENRILDYIPAELIERTHETYMRITLTNGSTIQIIGTDNIDAKMGLNFKGVVMSEYPLQDKKAWQLIEPILIANGGWAWFPYTPRGRYNHGYDLYQAALELRAEGEPWFVEKLGIDDTGLMVDDDLKSTRAQGATEAFIRQEYYCDFNVETDSKYFAKDMAEAEEAGRVNNKVLWDPNKLVHTSWDFGVRDATAICFWQRGDYDQWHCIDYIEDFNAGISHYAKLLHEKPYAYGTHLVPHDGRQRDKNTGMSTVDFAQELDVEMTVVDRTGKMDQINAGHALIWKTHFHSYFADKLIQALYNYERKYSAELKSYANSPLHNWASHPTDAFMTFAVGNPMIIDWDDVNDLQYTYTGRFNARTMEADLVEKPRSHRLRDRQYGNDTRRLATSSQGF